MAVSRRMLLVGTGSAAVAGAAAVVTFAAGLRPARRSGPVDVTLAAGPRRSVYLGWAEALAYEVSQASVSLRVNVRTSTGAVENLGLLQRGDVTFAVASADAAAAALRGQPPFTAPIALAALARVYDDYVHLIVREDTPLTELAELAGRRVAVGPPGSGTALVAARLLAVTGVRVKAVRMDVVDAGYALQGRRLDAVLWLGGLPTRAVSELAARVRVRLLPLSGVATELRARHGSAYRAAVIPALTYAQPGGVPTVASANLLLCLRDTDDEQVSTVLTTAFARRDNLAAAHPAGNALDRRAAISTQPVSLHRAAIDYYRSGKP